VFHHLDVDFCSSSPEVSAKKIDNVRSMIWGMIYSTRIDPVMAQSHNDQGGIHLEFLVYALEEPIEQPNNSFNHLGSFVAATEAIMRFSAVLPMGGSHIASSS